MKKFLIAALFLTGLAFITPSAQAGCSKQVLIGYDRFGHPVYQQVYSSGYEQPRRGYYDRAPVQYRSYNYGRNDDDRRSYRDSRCRESRPRFSISFGN